MRSSADAAAPVPISIHSTARVETSERYYERIMHRISIHSTARVETIFGSFNR